MIKTIQRLAEQLIHGKTSNGEHLATLSNLGITQKHLDIMKLLSQAKSDGDIYSCNLRDISPNKVLYIDERTRGILDNSKIIKHPYHEGTNDWGSSNSLYSRLEYFAQLNDPMIPSVLYKDIDLVKAYFGIDIKEGQKLNDSIQKDKGLVPVIISVNEMGTQVKLGFGGKVIGATLKDLNNPVKVAYAVTLDLYLK